MTKYRVVLDTNAYADIEKAVRWISEYDPDKAFEWFEELEKVIQSLSALPERCPHALENEKWGSEEIRQLLFQKYPTVYRILYTVKEDEVRVLQMRHGARRYLQEE